MIAKLKALGLALVAVLAMSAIVATAAQATAGTLTTFPEGKTVKIAAEQTAKFGAEAHEFVLTDHELEAGKFANFRCETVHLHGVGTYTTGATTFTLEPTTKGCTAFGQPATITTTGCHYLLHTGTPTTPGPGWHVVKTLICTGANLIKIVTGTCELTIGSQAAEGLTTSEVTNSGPGVPETAMDLLLHTNLHSIEYKVTKDAIGCPLKGTGTFKKCDYSGTTTLKATDSTTGAAVGITLH
jgi:hypothetical protein